MPLAELMREGARMMTICNACRYCEGYCAVFPAMERRLNFAEGDLNYLANLCHNCGECYYACQYAPPHEFAVDIPRTLEAIRVRSYEEYAWPAPLGRVFRGNGTVMAVVLALALIGALLIGSLALGGGRLSMPVRGGDFYQIIPHSVMAASFSAVGLFVAVALAVGLVRCWRDLGESPREFLRLFALGRAMRDVLTLRNLHGSGVDCAFAGEEKRSALRRWMHHLSFYGFLLCFAATFAGSVYHYAFGWPAPYAYTSVPVLLGTLGGIGLVIGPLGLYWLGRRRDPATGDPNQRGMDRAFIVLLILTSLTGLLLLALRETAAMGWLLIIHLGVVLALFLGMPYGKFVHGIYRAAALLKSALERSRPSHNLGSEG